MIYVHKYLAESRVRALAEASRESRARLPRFDRETVVSGNITNVARRNFPGTASCEESRIGERFRVSAEVDSSARLLSRIIERAEESNYPSRI